jgi:hypothetical protein
MNIPKKQSAVLLAFALVALPAAFAGDDKDVAKKFQKMDADGDGRISSAEYVSVKAEKQHWWNRSNNSAESSAHTPEQFSALDSDKDGFLSATELSAKLDRSVPEANTPTGRSSDYSPREKSAPATDPSSNSTSGGMSGSSNANGNGNGTANDPAHSERPGNSDGADKTK